MSLITLFTAPKPFTNPHIALIQRNALRSWQALGSDVEILVIGEEAGLAETCAELGLRHLPQVRRNASGTPLVSSIFELARQNSSSPLLAYVNADILVRPDFVESARQVAEQAKNYLIVGQRWDLRVEQPLEFGEGWAEQLLERTQREGKLHPRHGSDYFIFPRSGFTEMPDFAIGRAGWDNWMIFRARWLGWPVVDGSEAIQIVHQDHDYSHLPGGQPHYRLPETTDNVRMAGGRRTIFNLIDADRRLVNGRLTAVEQTAEKRRREAEIFPLVKLHSFLLGNLAYGLFHPKKAYPEFRQWLQGKR